MAALKVILDPLGRWLPGRPAFSVVLLFSLGIALHSYLPRSALASLILLAMLVLASLQLRRYPRLMTPCIALAIVAAGVAIAQMAAYQFRPNHIGHFATEEPRLASLELQFDQTPELLAESGSRHLPGKQSGTANVVAVKTWKGWEKASGEILFTVSQTQPRIVAGQRVRVVGMLGRPAAAMNPGEFDWEAYCRRQGILASIRVNRACDVQVMHGGVAPTIAEARVGVRDWIALGFSRDHQVDCALLQALMLGDRAPELRSVQRDFQKTGTSHLLSSSGVRMSVLAGMLYLLCRLVRARPRLAVTVLTLGVLGWGCLTLSTPQAWRPMIVAVIIGIGLIRRRTGDALQFLTFAALLLLIVQPLDIYSAGFQFSFIIVAGMLLFTRRFTGQLTQFYDPHEAALARFGKLTRWQLLRRKCVHHFVQLIAASAVAWAISLPLVAYHFEQFTPWALPIGIVLSPVVLAALCAGFLKLILSMLMPSMAPTWAAIAGVPVALLRRAMALAAHLPFADVPIAQPPVWAIVLFYALLCLLLIPATRRRVQWAFRCVSAGVCPLLIFMPGVLGFVRQSPSSGTVRITLLSIGAGQCAVVEPPIGDALMVDAGSTTLSDPLHQCVGPFLHHEGRRALDSIYLSHGDYDHISATEGAVDELDVHTILTTPFFRAHADESRPCRHLLEFLDGNGHTPHEVTAGQSFDWGGGAVAEVLWPPKSCNMNSNNAGMVLRVSFGGKSILFPADIQDPAMRELLKKPAKLKSDILVAAHHGSSETLTAEFVRAVDPEVIISSNAAKLTKKQRDFEKMIEHRPLYRTNQCGAITIEIDRDGKIRVKPFLERKHRGMEVGADGAVRTD
ncbi:MAG TPA: ComEC/Rec2 family competence protein [Tepidisphaeraceae bacterium]|jgi:competence protein ComEC|nr:ComEC/Rec2 family competence protein [Tepidisphaeraceae bacterium]